MNSTKANRVVVSLLAFTGMLATAVRSQAAEGAVAAKSRYELVAPFVEENTFLIGCADVSRVDPGAIESWVNDLLKGGHADADAAKDLTQGMAGARQAAGGWMASFTKAGGRQLYVVMSLLDLPYPVIVVPITEGADAKAIEALFAPEDNGLRAEQIGQDVVVAPASTLQRIHDSKPVDRPDLSAALAAAGDATVAIAFAPPADTRRVVEEMMPALPPELGGGATVALTRGLRWISLGLRLPPDPSIDLTVRAKDAESAKELAGQIDTILKSLTRMMGQEQDLPGLGKLAAALTPRVSADHPDELKVVLDKTAIQGLVGAELPDQLIKARAKAKTVQSMNNIRQLVLACYQYADAHKGDWPDDLEKAAKADGIGPETLVNPVKPDSKPGYTYISPGKASEIKDYSSRMVIYETEGLPTRRNVGFADGHVQAVQEAEFQKYLKEAREAAAKRGKGN